MKGTSLDVAYDRAFDMAKAAGFLCSAYSLFFGQHACFMLNTCHVHSSHACMHHGVAPEMYVARGCEVLAQ